MNSSTESQTVQSIQTVGTSAQAAGPCYRVVLVRCACEAGFPKLLIVKVLGMRQFAFYPAKLRQQPQLANHSRKEIFTLKSKQSETIRRSVSCRNVVDITCELVAQFRSVGMYL
jgi:hypothetical protein